MSWIYLFLAGFFEIAWAIGLNHIVAGVLTIAGTVAGFYFLAIALKHIPLGTAYAVWTGTGIVGTAISEIILFGEPCNMLRLICIALITAGIVGLRLI